MDETRKQVVSTTRDGAQSQTQEKKTHHLPQQIKKGAAVWLRTTGNGPHNEDMPFDSDWVHPFDDGACASLMKAKKKPYGNVRPLAIKASFCFGDCVELTRA